MKRVPGRRWPSSIVGSGPSGGLTCSSGRPASPVKDIDAITPPLRIVHLIPNLQSGGGAQAVLYRLVAADAHNRHTVITLLEKGTYAADLEARGVTVVSLGLRGMLDAPRLLLALVRTMRRARPDVVQTWMYHSDLLGGVAARLCGIPVVWGLHHTTFEKGGSSRTVRLSALFCAWLSSFVPRRIVSCSTAGIEAHERKGYAADRLVVVHNGYDTRAFTPRAVGDEDALRAELEIGPATRLFGMAARWDPQKDHANLSRALQRLGRRDVGSWHCVLFGSGIDAGNGALVNLIEHHGLGERVSLLGRREDVIEVMRSLDIHVLSSRFGEAFPNVLNESMLVGTPCVTTTIGDSALIVGDTGWAVPPGDPDALSRALESALEARADPVAWSRRRVACRQRIVDNFSLETMTEGYRTVWAAACHPGRTGDQSIS